MSLALLVTCVLLVQDPPNAGTASAPAPAAAVAQVAVAVADVERVASAIERALPEARHVRMRFRVRSYPPSKPGAKPNFNEPGRSEECSVITMRGPAFLSVIQEGRGSATVWLNGYTYRLNGAEGGGTVSKGRAAGLVSVDLGLLLQTAPDLAFGFSGVVGQPALVIRESRPVAFVQNGTLATLTFVPKAVDEAIQRRPATLPPATPFTSELTVDLADPPRLVESRSELPRGPKATRSEFMWTRVHEWQTVGAMTLPRILHSRWPVRTTDDEHWAVTLVESAEALDPSDEIAPPLPEGMRITDDALGLRFTVGSPDITYGGKSLRLKEPLREHPGDRLETLLREAIER